MAAGSDSSKLQVVSREGAGQTVGTASSKVSRRQHLPFIGMQVSSCWTKNASGQYLSSYLASTRFLQSARLSLSGKVAIAAAV